MLLLIDGCRCEPRPSVGAHLTQSGESVVPGAWGPDHREWVKDLLLTSAPNDGVNTVHKQRRCACGLCAGSAIPLDGTIRRRYVCDVCNNCPPNESSAIG